MLTPHELLISLLTTQFPRAVFYRASVGKAYGLQCGALEFRIHKLVILNAVRTVPTRI